MFVSEWTYALEIPLVADVHKVVHAYFRTSEQGEWREDDEEASDAFVLRYRRGRWKRSMFGLGSKLVPSTCLLDDTTAVPLRLTVTLRPSPELVRIGLRFRFFWPYSPSRKVRRKAGEIVSCELESFSEHLKRCYTLPALPEITT